MRGPPGGVWLRFPTRDHAYRSSQRDRGGGAPGRPRPRGGAQAEGQGPRDRGRVRRCRRRPAARRAVHRGRRDHRRPVGRRRRGQGRSAQRRGGRQARLGRHADRLPRAAHEPRGRPGPGQRRRDRDRHGGHPAHLARPVHGRALQPGQHRRLPVGARWPARCCSASIRCS